MPRKSRKSISLKGLSYLRLKQHCEGQGKSISGTVEDWMYEKLHKAKPKKPHYLYVVSDVVGPLPAICVCAPDREQAAEWGSLELGTKADVLDIKEATDYDQSRITYGYIGVLTDLERQELCAPLK